MTCEFSSLAVGYPAPNLVDGAFQPRSVGAGCSHRLFPRQDLDSDTRRFWGGGSSLDPPPKTGAGAGRRPVTARYRASASRGPVLGPDWECATTREGAHAFLAHEGIMAWLLLKDEGGGVLPKRRRRPNNVRLAGWLVGSACSRGQERAD